VGNSLASKRQQAIFALVAAFDVEQVILLAPVYRLQNKLKPQLILSIVLLLATCQQV